MSDKISVNFSPIKKFIKDGEINIDQVNWQELNKTYSQQELTDFIVQEVQSGNIDLPMRKLSLWDAHNSFYNLLEYTCHPYQFGDVVTRFDYSYPLSGRYISETSVGNIASDYFQQANRYKAEGHGNPSPIRTWSTPQFVRTMCGSLWSMKHTEVTTSVLRSCLALRKYIASQYKPSIQKSIYEKFNSKDVLDFSQGWGDRLCGFYACQGASTYIGIDPNTDVYNKYYEQVDMYSKIVSDKYVTLYNLPQEDVKLESNIVDTVFTSPPYFNAEKYTVSDTQSFVRYKDVDKWLNGFMYPTLDTCWKALKDGGYLIINISDVYTQGKRHKICDPMNDYIKSLGGVFVEGLGMEMSRRPNSGALNEKEGIVVEPIWVWKKTSVFDGKPSPDAQHNFSKFSFNI